MFRKAKALPLEITKSVTRLWDNPTKRELKMGEISALQCASYDLLVTTRNQSSTMQSCAAIQGLYILVIVLQHSRTLQFALLPFTHFEVDRGHIVECRQSEVVHLALHWVSARGFVSGFRAHHHRHVHRRVHSKKHEHLGIVLERCLVFR